MSNSTDFWLVTGTAAPVIALAAAVALPNASSLHPELTEKAKEMFTENLQGISESRWWSDDEFIEYSANLILRRALGYRLATVSIRLIAVGNVVSQAFLLGASLTALQFSRDVIPKWVATALAVGGILILALMVTLISTYQRTTKSKMQRVIREMAKWVGQLEKREEKDEEETQLESPAPKVRWERKEQQRGYP